MIKNDRQYRTTKAHLERFERAREESALVPAPADVHLRLLQAQADALAGQMEDLRAELVEYEALRSGQRAVIQAESLADLPRVLIQARIASGLDQRALAERLGLKEQQIQRYEANDYAGASLERLREVAKALGLRLRQEVLLPGIQPSLSNLFSRLAQVGLERAFVCCRLLPRPLAARLRDKVPTHEEPSLAIQAAEVVGRVFGFSAGQIFGSGPLVLANVGGLLRFKLSANVEERRLGAYSLYAHHLAHALLDAVPERPRVPIPTDPKLIRAAILAAYGELTLGTALHYASDLGIVVLPLRDAGAFHGAYLRVEGRHVIILKQQTASFSRWLFDLLHELRHAGEQPEKTELSVLEEQEASPERRASPAERIASRFAGEVQLDGRAEVLAQKCVSTAGGAVERLKTVVPRVARSAGLSTADLANYVAFRLSLQGLNWWGAAQNLQDLTGSPWTVARDHLLTQVRWELLPEAEKALVELALTTVDTE